MVLRQDLENTVYSELGGLRRAVGVYVRARSTTLYLLPVTGERRKVAISSSLKSHLLFCCRKAKIFSVFPSLNDAYTNTATGEEAIALVKVRCELR